MLAGRVAIAEHHAAGRFELANRLRVREVVALAVRDRQAQHPAASRAQRERRIGLLDANVNVLAVELQVAVPQHRARQQPASSRTWKPLQMPSTGPPAAANSATAFITGEKRAIAPVRR